MILALALTITAFAQAPVHFIRLDGGINQGSASFIQSALKKAEGAEALIIELNTPGGLLTSTREIVQTIAASKTPVVIYVSPSGARAASAGALITLSSHIAAMAPGTNIGAAHPVGGAGEDVKGALGDKITNDTAALARSQAELRGRNSVTAENIVTKSVSLSAEEAKGKGVVELVAPDLNALLLALDKREVLLPNGKRKLSLSGVAPEDLVESEMTLKEKSLQFLSDPNISTLLMTIGGTALYVEVSSGFAVLAPGIVGVFCLILALVSMQTLPINMGGALLFGLGFALLAAEVFITSYGLLTVGALVSIFLGGLFLIDPASSEIKVSLSLLTSLVGSVGLVLLAIAYLLKKEKPAQAPASEGLRLRGQSAKIIETSGLSGTAQVEGELWSFTSTEILQKGEEALVESLDGLSLKLKRRK